MKAIRLTVKNIGIIADAVIALDKPLIIFYGEIRQGKTTILNAVKWVFGGTFPTDIIRTGETEAEICLDLDCGSIRRTFYVARDGSTKSRPLVFTRDGVAVKDAVAEVRKFLNPFLLDQNFLAEKSELERKKYFTELFSVNTSDLNAQIDATVKQAEVVRSKLKAYGDIDLTPVAEPADITALQQARAQIIAQHGLSQQAVHVELAKRRDEYSSVVREYNLQASTVRENNHNVNFALAEQTRLHQEVDRLKDQLRTAESNLQAKMAWVNSHPLLPEPTMPTAPDLSSLEALLSVQADTEEVDTQLRQAEADKVRHQVYLSNLGRQKSREADEALILSLDATTRELRAKRIAKLQEISEATGIPGLAFDEAGNFSFEGCTAGMLSTSQLMRLSSLLSALYPEGFGIDLIDRAESLGKSVFEFVDRAKAENKTILAAVVGERPAVVPAEVGVFVVEGGKLS